MKYVNKKNNVFIEAADLQIGSNVQFGNDISINVRGKFELGDNSVIGDRFTASAENIKIGDYFFNLPTDSRGMLIGGGASKFPNANLTIGTGAVCHTGHINIASPVNIGDDVGLSHDVDIITHGFWASVLDGYPRSFKPVNIGNNVIIGWKTVIMPGVDICDNIVIGAHSTITKSIDTPNSIYAGTPAKFIKEITIPDINQQKIIFNEILSEFSNLIKHYEVDAFVMHSEFPVVFINNLKLDLINKTASGEHDLVTDAFRDFLRRYGIRIFSPRGFSFNLNRII